jgi:hypothetical protein
MMQQLSQNTADTATVILALNQAAAGTCGSCIISIAAIAVANEHVSLQTLVQATHHAVGST